MMNRTAASALSWLVTVLTPILLIGLALRVMLAPWFLHVEYRMPYFPADEYGFTTADRLHWAPYALDYLINNADISYLGDLKFEDGTSLYNARELSHMHDVQRVTQAALRTWMAAVAVLALLALWAWRSNWMPAYLRGLRRGGWFMLILTAALALFASVAFWQFFTLFHEIVFPGGFVAVRVLGYAHPPVPPAVLAGCFHLGRVDRGGGCAWPSTGYQSSACPAHGSGI